VSDRFASSKNALGICDRSGFTYKLKDLVYEIRDGERTGLRVGRDIVDPDHPQNFLGKYPVDDPQALRDPRPDTAELTKSRGIQFGWDPVGLVDPFGLTSNDLVGTVSLGSVTVNTG
jgi:hypothetical protein